MKDILVKVRKNTNRGGDYSFYATDRKMFMAMVKEMSAKAHRPIGNIIYETIKKRFIEEVGDEEYKKLEAELVVPVKPKKKK